MANTRRRWTGGELVEASKRVLDELRGVACSEYLLMAADEVREEDEAKAEVRESPAADPQAMMRTLLVEGVAVHASMLLDFLYAEESEPGAIVADDFFDHRAAWARARPQLDPALEAVRRVGHCLRRLRHGEWILVNDWQAAESKAVSSAVHDVVGEFLRCVPEGRVCAELLPYRFTQDEMMAQAMQAERGGPPAAGDRPCGRCGRGRGQISRKDEEQMNNVRRPRTVEELVEGSEMVLEELRGLWMAELLLTSIDRMPSGDEAATDDEDDRTERADLPERTRDAATAIVGLHAGLVLDFLYPTEPEPDDVVAEDFFDDPIIWREQRPEMNEPLAAARRTWTGLRRLRYGGWVEPEDWEATGSKKLLDMIVPLVEAFLRMAPEERTSERLRVYLAKEEDSGDGDNT